MDRSLVIIILLKMLTIHAIPNDTRTENPIERMLKLKKINYKYEPILNKSAIKIPPIDKDAEEIFLPLSPQNHHLDQVLERITDTTNQEDDQGSGKQKEPFDVLNFDAYVLKPLNVDYAQIFEHLRPKVEKEKQRIMAEGMKDKQQNSCDDQAHHLSGLHIDTTSYNRLYNDEETFEPQDIEPVRQNNNSTEPKALPLTATLNEFAPNERAQIKNKSLPLGFAFFEALNTQNRPQFSPYTGIRPDEEPKKLEKLAKDENTSAEELEDDDENNDEWENNNPLTHKAQINKLIEFYGVKTNSKLPKVKSRQINKKQKKSNEKSKRHGDRNSGVFHEIIYYPQESRTIGKSYSNYYPLQNIQFGRTVRNPFASNKYTKESTAIAMKSSPKTESKQRPPPTELSYFQYANVFGNGTYNAGVGRGNNIHFIEQHERSDKGKGIYQKRVRWGDRKGGFGEHFYDLNHH